MKNMLLLSLFIISVSLHAQSAAKTPGCLDSLQVPTTFTPNGDSANDFFSIYFPCEPEKFEITVFNRWGNEIFASKESTFHWAGTDSKGEHVAMGVYFYILKFTYLKEEKTIQGNVHVMR